MFKLYRWMRNLPHIHQTVIPYVRKVMQHRRIALKYLRVGFGKSMHRRLNAVTVVFFRKKYSYAETLLQYGKTKFSCYASMQVIAPSI